MKSMWTMLIAVLVAGSLVWATGVVAQTQAPAQPAPATGGASGGAAGMDKQIEGQVKAFDAAGKKLTLADGTEVMIPATVKTTDLKPGAKVKVSYEEKGGQKVAKQLQVSP